MSPLLVSGLLHALGVTVGTTVTAPQVPPRPSIIRVIQESSEDDPAAALRALEAAVRQGASLEERGANDSNALIVAVYGEKFFLLPRLLALGIPITDRNAHGYTAWDLVVRRTGILPADSDWGKAQATLGLAWGLEQSRRGAAIRATERFEGKAIAIVDPWDQMTMSQSVQSLENVGIPAGIVHEEVQFGGIAPGAFWLCVRSDLEGKARQRLLRNPRVAPYLKFFIKPAGSNGPTSEKFRDLNPSVAPDRKLIQAIRASLTFRLWPPSWATLKRFQARARTYWDTSLGKPRVGQELRLVLRLQGSGKDSVYRSQKLADGTITRWFLQSGPSPW
ncbi:MAG: hypothetical protein ACO1SV_05525 [Fimbriimonas sp.]